MMMMTPMMTLLTMMHCDEDHDAWRWCMVMMHGNDADDGYDDIDVDDHDIP